MIQLSLKGCEESKMNSQFKGWDKSKGKVELTKPDPENPTPENYKLEPSVGTAGNTVIRLFFLA